MATAEITVPTEADILLEVFEGGKALEPETAQWLLTLHFNEKQKARAIDLAERNSAGTLLPGEKEELMRLVHIGDVLTIWHLKARQALRNVARSADDAA